MHRQRFDGFDDVRARIDCLSDGFDIFFIGSLA
jgi:hypothetical protein